jgi:hypothetical protein
MEISACPCRECNPDHPDHSQSLNNPGQYDDDDDDDNNNNNNNNALSVLLFNFALGYGSRRSRDSSITLGYGLVDRGFESREKLGIFLFTTASRPALGPTHLPIQWVPEALFLGVKRPGHEADNPPPSSAEVKNAWRYTSTPPICLHGMVFS